MSKRFLHILLAALLALTLFSCQPDDAVEEEGGKTPETVYYRNPLIEKFVPDPHIIRHGDAFYIFTTAGRIYKSTDTVAWTVLEGGVGLSPNWGSPGAGFWAPDIQKIGDRFLLYYSLSMWGDENPGIGIASASHPEGPWVDHGKLFTSHEIGVENSIDADVFVDHDGRVYLTWGSFRGIFGVELTADGTALKNGIDHARENKVLLAGVVGEWDGATYEAPYVIRHDGYYYMFLSTGTCCDGLSSTYQVKVGRADAPLGDYRDSEGNSMKGRNVGHHVLGSSSKLIGPGHNSIFIDDAGDYFIVYHLYKNVDGEAVGRGLGIDRLVWENGWCHTASGMPSDKAEIPKILPRT